MGIAGDIVIIVVAALLGGLVAQRLGQPLIVGYILAGIVVGPYTGGVTVGNVEQIRLLAEIGVVLLLFTLGIQFSLASLKPVARLALIGTPLQIILTMAWGLAIGAWLGLDWYPSLWFGAAIATSNTMIILKILSGRGLLGTLSSRVMIGILIMQDILIMIVMLILPELDDPIGGLPGLALGLVRAGLFVGVMALVGTRVIPWLMRYIAQWNSRELFLVATVALALGVGYVTYLFGLSFAFGAFVAGLILSESDYSHQTLSDIVPLRDVFALLFFVSIGMLLDPIFLWNNIGTILAVTALVALGKGLILGLIVLPFGYRAVVPIAVAFGMFQLGEFSFVLSGVALNLGIFSEDIYSLVLAVALLSILVTPLAFRAVEPIDRLRRRFSRGPTFTPINVEGDAVRGHVVIAGAGRVGQYVAGVLHRLNLAFVAIELNQSRVDQCKDRGFPVIYGDATQPQVLEAAGIGRAQLLLVTGPSVGVNLPIVRYVHGRYPDLHIVARAEGIEQVEDLNAQGVHEVVQPEFEAALEMARQALLHMEMAPGDIQRYTDDVRAEHYAPVYSVHKDYAMLTQMRRAQHLLDVGWVELAAGGELAGITLGAAAVRSRTGVSVVAIVRGGAPLLNPDASILLAAGDMLAVLGDAEQRAAFVELAKGSGDGFSVGEQQDG